jgi:mono/diheme cytochrome c family protein
MMRWPRSGAALLCCFVLGPLAAAGDMPAPNRGRVDYVLHCSGCHAFDGRGLEHKGIPALKDRIGYYLRSEEGRAFLMQVPGLLSAGMPDQRAADVTNYVIYRFAGASLPEGFAPYTAAEAKRYRESRPANIPNARKALVAKLQAEGVPIW